jgi:hypothetical protein
LKVQQPLSAAQELSIQAYIENALGTKMKIKIEIVDGFAASKGGKFYPAMRVF